MAVRASGLRLKISAMNERQPRGLKPKALSRVIAANRSTAAPPSTSERDYASRYFLTAEVVSNSCGAPPSLSVERRCWQPRLLKWRTQGFAGNFSRRCCIELAECRHIEAASKRRFCKCGAVFLLFRRLWDCALHSPRSHKMLTYGSATATMTAGLGGFTAKAERWLSVVTTIVITDGTTVLIRTLTQDTGHYHLLDFQ
jgi:hypothetical protein